MSADHRKPFLAFVVLAFVAAAIVGVQRADAQPGRFLAAVVTTSVRVHGTLPTGEISLDAAGDRLVSLGPAFSALGKHVPAFDGSRVDAVGTSAPDETSRVRWERDSGPGRDEQASEEARRRRSSQGEERSAGRPAEALERAHEWAGPSAERAHKSVRGAAEALEKAASKNARRAPEASERGHSRWRRMLARAGHGSR